MKKGLKTSLRLFLLLLISFIFLGCGEETYTIKLNDEESYILESNKTDIDFTKYFVIKDQNGKEIEVTSEMLDLSKVDFTKDTFMISISYQGINCEANFFVKKIDDGTDDKSIKEIKINNNKNLVINETVTLSIEKTPSDATCEVIWSSSDESIATVSETGLVKALREGTVTIKATVKATTITDEVTIKVTKEKEENENPKDLTDVLDKYNEYEDWNFFVDFIVKATAEGDTTDVGWDYKYSYQGYNFSLEYDYDGEHYIDYVVYDENADVYYYYALEDGKYVKYTEDDDYFEYYYSDVDYLEISKLSNYAFTLNNGVYEANDPQEVGGYIFDSYEGDVWKNAKIEISDGFIKKITAELQFVNTEENKKYTYEYELLFSKNNQISLDLDSLGGGSDDPDPDNGNTSTFTDKGLSVGTGEIEYTTTSNANGFTTERGVQYTQNNGEVVIKSKNDIENLTSVTIVCQTNAPMGMEVKVKVGDVSFICDGNQIVKVSQTAYDVFTTLTFKSETACNGVVEITLTPCDTSKSMYIKSVSLNGTNGGSGNEDNKQYMEKQTDTNESISNSRLQDEVLKVDEAIGLPSSGTYSALVIPVKFTNTTISNDELNRLREAFNGTSQTTGWESVSSYYKKASYGKLEISFDILDVYSAKKDSTYYLNYRRQVVFENGKTAYQTGDEVLLLEVLAYLEPLIDLSKYDVNKDGVIDAVYLIYSEDVTYEDSKTDPDNFFWAYTTYYIAPENENQTFDNLDAYYFLFAGFDFMDEDSKNGFEYNGKIDTLLINAGTYIHETGHLLLLDDYYDYDTKVGSNQGLGGADMMDYTVGDHCSYSKIMLNWVTPVIVSSTQTIDLTPFEDNGNVIMILLKGNNTYFSEYLLVDLYTNTGLNELHAKAKNSYLYNGAEYGVHIYHVSSTINNPYASEYGSFTDYNNTDTNITLIKLIEADGEKNFKSTDGYASSKDLWSTGKVFSNYKRNDGKTINFSINFTSVSKTKATLQISFND